MGVGAERLPPQRGADGPAPGPPLAAAAGSCSRRIAIVLSVTLHGVVLWLVTETAPWQTSAAPAALTATLVFIEPRAPASIADTAVLPSPEPPPSPEPLQLPELSNDVRAVDAAESQTASAAAVREPAAAEAPSPRDEEQPPALPPIDWDAAGRNAIEAWLDRQPGADDRFAGDALVGNAPQSEGRSARSPFESSAPPRVALQPNRSRSAIVRRIGSICQGLTGGVSLFGLVALCTDATGRRDLFAAIRPDYLDELPECEQVTLAPDAQAMAIDAGLPTEPVKCRMVHRDERYRE